MLSNILLSTNNNANYGISFFFHQICLGLARLLHYLAHSPLGPLFIRDFKLSQFILVSGEVKLTDFDDVDNEEPRCSADSDCVVRGIAKNKTLKCVSGRCQGVVAATNLDNACRNVISHVLVPGAPKKLRGHLKEVKQNLQRLIWNTDTFVWHLERVLNLLHAGKHRGKNYSQGIKQRGGNLPASYRGVFCCGYGCAP